MCAVAKTRERRWGAEGKLGKPRLENIRHILHRDHSICGMQRLRASFVGRGRSRVCIPGDTCPSVVCSCNLPRLKDPPSVDADNTRGAGVQEKVAPAKTLMVYSE